MRIATWNCNSIRSRVDRAVALLARHDIDVLALQETKCKDSQFPVLPFEAAGYEVAFHGLNQWNGVAIASRVGLTDATLGFPGMPEWGEPELAPLTRRSDHSLTQRVLTQNEPPKPAPSRASVPSGKAKVPNPWTFGAWGVPHSVQLIGML